MKAGAGIKNKNGQRGFTLVELLIVVVIIAILAAITVVAYNGITARTANTVTLQGVAQYTKIFSMYAIDHGTYPAAASGYYPCLGSGWQGDCARTTQGSSGCNYAGVARVDTAFNAQIAQYAQTMPTIDNQSVSCNGDVYTGAFVNNNTTNTGALSIIFFQKGNVPCPATLGVAKLTSRLQADQTTDCRYDMPALN